MAFFAGQGLFIANYFDTSGSHSTQLRRVLAVFAIALLPAMVAWVWQGQDALVSRSGRFTMGELNAVGVAFLFGNVFAISFTLFLFNQSYSKAIWAAVALLSLMIVLQTASRGPLLAAVAVVIVPILFASAPELRRSRLTTLTLGVVFVGIVGSVIVYYLPEQFDFLIRRVNRLLEDGADLNRASSGRIEIWMHYITLRDEGLWVGNPRFGGEADAYAHNLLLDIGITFGIVGIVFLVVQLFFLGKLLMGLRWMRLDPYMVALLTAGIFTLMVSAISCRIFMLRSLWLVMGIATASAALPAATNQGLDRA
jgi:hypothetical protein